MLRCPRCGKQFEADTDADVPSGRCDACGTELVRDGAAPVALPRYTELVRVYEARGEADLAVVRAILEGADVPVFAYGESAGFGRSLARELKMLLVPVDFAKRAQHVLRERGVLKPAPAAAPGDELARLWAAEVVAVLAGGPVAGLAAEIAFQPEAFRAALFGALEAAGRRGTAVLEELTLALAVRGPLGVARDAAGYLAASEAFRDRRTDLIATLGALVARGADAALAARAIAALERFRGLTESERALVPLLEHEDAAVRDAAIEALFSVSGGETLGYEPDADPAVRAMAVRAWWERVGGRPM